MLKKSVKNATRGFISAFKQSFEFPTRRGDLKSRKLLKRGIYLQVFLVVIYWLVPPAKGLRKFDGERTV